LNLTSNDLARFETAVADLVAAAEVNTGEAERLCAKAFEELREGGLADDEISRRARRIGESLRESQKPLLTALTSAARDAGPNIRSGVLAVLTPALRAELYRSPDRPESDKDSTRASATVDMATEEPDEAGEDLEVEGEWQTVLLLGDADEIQSNERFLDQYDIRAIRVADESALAALAGESFSAVVVHPGFWGSIPADRKIADVLRAQFQRASIAHFRIDSAGLGDAAAEVDELLQELGSELRSRIVLAAGSQLSDIDVIAIRRFSALLESAKSSRITVEGLTERESRLLCASVALLSWSSIETITVERTRPSGCGAN
jgi:hypothetical protein